MKRIDLIRHLETHGCILFREGAKHSIYKNPRNGVMTTVPRHREVKNFWRESSATILAFRARSNA